MPIAEPTRAKRWTVAILALCGFVAVAAAAEPVRLRENFDSGWRFFLGDAAGAEKAEFDAGPWRMIDLPHDWSIEGSIVRTNPMGGAGGFFPAGVGWYRRQFAAPAAWSGKRVMIEFEGVYMNAAVWLNGEELGSHPYGYTSFYFDLTPHLKPGGTNTLAVRVDNSKHINSRWYSGSGIYRHVWLTVIDPVHFGAWGVFVTTPEVSAEQAQVQVQTVVRNDSDAPQDCSLETRLIDANGRTVGTGRSTVNLAAHAEATTTQAMNVSRPLLWSPETPRLYRAASRVLLDNQTADEVQTPFGIRSIKVSPENGFQLNGRTIKLCAGCVHHDNGCLGAAAFDRAEERRVELLKAAGFNALRTAHNPPSPAFLDACDRLGMLVLDESFDCWEQGKNRNDYHLFFTDWWQRDLDAMVLRDRNHPSVFMWSIGNEIEERGKPEGDRIAQMLAGRIRSLDRTRPLTAALCGLWSEREWARADNLFTNLDVAGYNYMLWLDRSDHQRLPSRIMAATESRPRETFENWARVADQPYLMGDFVWTALDYLGEAGIGRWFLPGESSSGHGNNNLYPWHGAWCGDLDLTGWRKPISHYRNILWNRGEKIYLAVREPESEGRKITVTDWGVWPTWPSWTWPGWEGRNLDVEVCSTCDKVRLYLNEKLLGEKPTTRAEQFKATFSVPYAPGSLKAFGVRSDHKIAESVLDTAGPATRVRLSPDRATIRADGQDLSFITVEVLDPVGRLQPNDEHSIHFNLSGPGVIAGMDNGDLKNADAYQANERKVWHGRALVVIRSAHDEGKIRLTATSPGLREATLTIQSGRALR
jgi:beta-galactosidase